MKNEEIEVEIVDENQIVLSEIKYPVSETDLKALLSEYSDIPDINPDTDDEIVGKQYKFVLNGHRAFVKARTGIEKTRKALKQPALEYGKKVDSIAKEFQLMIKSTEDKLFIQRKIVEDNEARKQAEAEEKEEQRIDNIKIVINGYKDSTLQCVGKTSIVISDTLQLLETPQRETLEEFYDEGILVFESSVNQIKQMLENQLLVENAHKIQEEKDRELARQKEEQEELAKIEARKLADEKADFEQQKQEFERQQREQQEIIDRQRADIEAEELAKKQEFERQQREQQEKKELANRQREDKKRREEKIATTLESMNKYNDNGLLLNEIIAGAIPNIRWDV